MKKGTWEMTTEELARVVSEHNGWKGQRDGFIRDTDGVRVVQGYSMLGSILEDMGVIEVGKGVHWRRQRIHSLASTVHPEDISLELARRVRTRFVQRKGWRTFKGATA